MDIDAYMKRIDYAGACAPTLELLRAIHYAHLCAVPFENLDIHAGRAITLDESEWFEKVVTQRRGGFCYELNGLFAALLHALGFAVSRLSARVRNEAGELGPEYDHMALLVRVDGNWLADVGFGRSFREPLCLDAPAEQLAEDKIYRAIRSGEQWQMQSRDAKGSRDFVTEYVFSLDAQPLAAFGPMCQFHQTSPLSPFTRKLVCSRATPNGRVTVSGDSLIITDNEGNRQTQPITSLAETLRDTFAMLPRAPSHLQPLG
jgi:N-hydroxyarylamine O-acetyltransferase